MTFESCNRIAIAFYPQKRRCSTIYQMNRLWRTALIGAVLGSSLSAQEKTETKVAVTSTPVPPPAPAPPPDSTTEGTATVGGQVITYRAVAGTLTVGATDVQDATLGLDGRLLPDSGEKPPDPTKPEDAPATARMFYTAYFMKGAPSDSRPVTFLYNGGPGSSTMWLHMGSFGPRRVSTTDTVHD